MNQLRRRGRVVIVTDSFDPMNRHFLDALPSDEVLSHRFARGADGLIERMDFWNGLVGEHQCFETVDHSQTETFAMGDAFNDLTMIRAARIGVLFQPSKATREAARDLRAVHSYADVLAALNEGALAAL